MKLELTAEQKEAQAAFRAFVQREIMPFADQWDRDQCTPPEVIKKLRKEGYMGAALPKSVGGGGMDMITYGLLNEEIGRGCSSIRSLLTVHNMLSQAVFKWGSEKQKEAWLPALVTGERIGAFGLTEPNIGSNAAGVETSAVLDGDQYVLNGKKVWTTYGQIADLFLIFARHNGLATAFIVEKDRPGFAVKPITDMLGVRASMLAELHLNDCRIPRENLLGKVGFGFSHVGSHALDYGRYTVAWGCVGIAQACLDASYRYASERQQFGSYIKEYQLIQQMLTNMITNVKAARLLCLQAGYLKDISDPSAFMETSIAKYFASLIAVKAADDAVQIHGANGCGSAYSVQRYMRDAKIMEIIEGSTQMQQINIAKYGYKEQG